MSQENSVPSYGACFVSLGLGMMPIFLIMGIAALFGANTVTANGGNVHGIAGLIVSVILLVVFAALFAGLQKLGYLILGLIDRRKAVPDT